MPAYLSLRLSVSRLLFLSSILPAVLPKAKNILASRFRSGSADEDDLLGPDINDFRYHTTLLCAVLQYINDFASPPLLSSIP